MPPAQLLGIAVEAALALLGLRLLWQHALSPGIRGSPPPARLGPWPGSGSDLLLFLLLSLGGALAFPIAADYALRRSEAVMLSRAVWDAAAFQAGLLAGIAAFHWCFAPIAAGLTGRPGESLRTGAGTFLLALPLVLGVALLWQSLLEACGVPVRKQDVVELFEQIHSPCLRVVFVLAALVIAPVTEEIIFRGGIFRFLRNRTPRWVAILAPAVAFGASHLFQSPLDGLAAFVPLVALGAIFSIAYERTGRIGTTIVAHALFNLNTLAALLLGVTR